MSNNRYWAGMAILGLMWIVIAACFIVGCLSAEGGDRGISMSEVGSAGIASSRPAGGADTHVSQDVAGVLTKAEVEAMFDARLHAEIAAIKVETSSSKNVTYGTDVWLGRIALVLAFLSFVFAGWQARKHGYWQQRKIRQEHEVSDDSC